MRENAVPKNKGKVMVENLLFTASHEWVKLDNQLANQQATIGISKHAQQMLGELVFIELPKLNSTIKQGDECAVVESVKAAADVYAPLSGKIIEINNQLLEQPSLVNSDCYQSGWIFKIALSDPQELDKLLSADRYHQLNN